MMWEYRVLTQGGHFTIQEVYKGVEGKCDTSWTNDDISAIGESPEELKRDLEFMIMALDKPILQETLVGKKLTLQELPVANDKDSND